MIKKIGITIILIALLFNYTKVNAEEYQIGDLVEVINPYEEDPNKDNPPKFYITGYDKELKQYHLITEKEVEIIKENIYDVIIDGDGIPENYNYIISLFLESKDENENFNFKFIEGTNINGCNTKDYYHQEKTNKYYFNCPEIYNKYINTIALTAYYQEYKINLFDNTTNGYLFFEKSDNNNYNFMATIYEFDNKIIPEKNTKYYISLILEEEQLNLIKKVEDSSKTETSTKENTNTIIESNNKVNTPTEENIENPKTSDLIIWIPLFLLIICGIATIIYIERKYKNEKIM